MTAVGAVNFGAPKVSFLWHNVVGAVMVVAVGLLVSAVTGGPAQRRAEESTTPEAAIAV